MHPDRRHRDGKAQAAPGSLDPSFSADGRASVDFGTSYAGAEALAIGQDGSILLVGGVDQGGPDEQLAMARFTAGGEPDVTFGGGDGAELFPYVAYAYGVALQGDGKIVWWREYYQDPAALARSARAD